MYPNGTQKKSPNRVVFRISARAICGGDSIGTWMFIVQLLHPVQEYFLFLYSIEKTLVKAAGGD